MDPSQRIPHSLIPLSLAVVVVRQDVYGKDERGDVDPNSIAAYIAGAVPLFEVSRTGAPAPRLLIDVNRQAVFRDGGRELVFLDGKPSKHDLAILASDVRCVVAMLKEPESAPQIRRQVMEGMARQLASQWRELRAHHLDLVEKFHQLSARTEELRLACDVRRGRNVAAGA